MKTLPVLNKKEEIVSAITKYDVVVLTAETGSGKSTQVPQFLYEAGYKVIVTQPRRIACVSLADFVSTQTNAVIGYHTAFENTVTSDTDIIFCTDGLQMVKTVGGCKVNNQTVLVIDEVHEWNLNVETIIAWLKHEYKSGNKIKVVIMSATFDTGALVQYFSDVALVTAIHIENKIFNVDWHYRTADDITDVIIDQVSKRKNVLVFQPGKREIDNCINVLKQKCENVVILPLHGELPLSAQKVCFQNYSTPKIIVATNVAQTSITIDDIDVVVDTGLEKFVETNDGLESLVYHHTSKADCIQRAGRAGRTKEGNYYLCSNVDFSKRQEYTTPEIQRLLLDKVVLKLSAVGLEAENLEFFHQPDKNSIIEAKRVLMMLGAYNKDGSISRIGHLMSKLPVGSKSARMLIEAAEYGVLDDMIIIAAIIENGSLLAPKFKDYYGDLVSNHYQNYLLWEEYHSLNSDVVAEELIFHKLSNNEIKDTNGINLKIYHKVRDYVEKLTQCAAAILTNKDIPYKQQNIIKAMLPSMVDNLFTLSHSDICCSLTSENTCKLSSLSCLEASWDTKFVIGFPVTISFTDRYGIVRSMNLLQFVSQIQAEDIIEVISPDQIEKRPVKVGYFQDDDRYIYDLEYRFKDYILVIKHHCMANHDDPLYELVQNTYNSSKNHEPCIQVCGKIYSVHWSYYDTPSIEVEQSDVLNFKKNGLTKIITPKGTKVSISLQTEDWYSKTFDTVDAAYTYCSQKIMATMVQELKKSFPSKTGKLETIITWLSEIGPRTITLNGMEEVVYVGLQRDKGTIQLDIFKNQEDSIMSSIQCCQFLIEELVKRKYGDKHFKVINWQGKKVENASTQKAKYEFHENVMMAIREVTVENFLDTLEYLDEIYQLCISEMSV